MPRLSTFSAGSARAFGMRSGKKVLSGTITYAIGALGSGSSGNLNGLSGGTTTLSYLGISLTANGGTGGKYNNNTASLVSRESS